MMIVMLGLILGANFYVFYRLWHMIPAGSVLRPALIVFAVVAVSSIFVALLAGGNLPSALTSFLYVLGTAWFFIMFYLLMTFLLLDIIRLLRLLPVDRFLFGSWTGLGILTALMALIFVGGYITYRNKERVELDITLPADKEIGRPLKIVAASDLHLGYSIGKKEFAGWVELINAEQPDIVLLAGDVIDNNIRPVLEQDMGAVFRQIRSTYGVYAAVGNHEYIGGLRDAVAFLQESGVTVLRDSAALVDDRFYIVGRDDRSDPGRKSIAELTAGLDPSKPVLLLDHQPYHLEEAEENGVTLQLSGHTHNGQVWPISWITKSMYEVSHGYKQKGDTHVYVSSGIGLWGGKFRIGTRSEYVVITLK